MNYAFCSYQTKFRLMKKVVFGSLVVSAGVLLFLWNLGQISEQVAHVIFSWPMLLIAFGLVNIVGKDSKGIGIVLISVGAFFIIPRAFSFAFNFSSLFWPILLVGIGLMILLQHKPARWKREHWTKKSFQKEEKVGFVDGHLSINNVFGGNKQILDRIELKSAEINCVFGGAELDLTQVTLASPVVEIETNLVFGGMSLIVPEGWKVKFQIESVFGGFVDKRRYFPNDLTSDSTLVIKGTSIFGGGEIRNP